MHQATILIKEKKLVYHMAAKKAAKKTAKTTKKSTAKKSVKKQAAKKAENTQEEVQQPSQAEPFPTVAVVTAAIFVVLVLAVAIFVVMWATPEAPQPALETQTLVIVNGQALTTQDLAFIRSVIDPMGTSLSDEQIIDQLILQTLLLQEAETRGIFIGLDQAEEDFSALLSAQGVPREEFTAILAQQGQSYEVLIEEYRKNLVLEALAEQLEVAPVTDEDAREFYEDYRALAGEQAPAFEELREDILLFLEEQARSEALEELGVELRETAVIEHQ